MACGCVSEMGESCESCESKEETQKRIEYELIQSLNRTLWVFDELRRISGQLHRLDEGDCNGRTEQGEKYSETREKNLMASAQSWTDKLNLGLIAYHQGDPRGCALYLITPAIKKSGQYPNGVAITSKPNYD